MQSKINLTVTAWLDRISRQNEAKFTKAYK